MRRYLFLVALGIGLGASVAQACAFQSWKQGFVFVDNEDASYGLISSWDAGFGGFFELSHPITPYFEVAPRIGATLVWFDEYKGEPISSIPEQTWSLQPIAPMPRLHFRLTFRAKASEPAYPFIELASEVMVVYVPEVKWTVWDWLIGRKFTVTHHETGKTDKKVFFGIGTGWLSPPEQGRFRSGFETLLMTSTDGCTQRFELAFFLVFD